MSSKDEKETGKPVTDGIRSKKKKSRTGLQHPNTKI